MSRTDLSTAWSRAVPSVSDADRTATPSAIPRIVRSERSGRAATVRHASRSRPSTLQADLGEPCDQLGGRVVGAPAEGDLLLDAPVTDDEHPIGVCGGAGVVRHQDDRLAALLARSPQGV